MPRNTVSGECNMRSPEKSLITAALIKAGMCTNHAGGQRHEIKQHSPGRLPGDPKQAGAAVSHAADLPYL